jgi:hypothetical protein
MLAYTCLVGKWEFAMSAKDADNTQGVGPEQLHLLGASKGGRARASVLTADERREIARAAARARWGKHPDDTTDPESTAVGVEEHQPARPIGFQRSREDTNLPFSMFQGTIKFGEIEAECHVLSDLRRVFTQREVVKVISEGRESGNLQRYLARNPLLGEHYDRAQTISFVVPPNQSLAIGYDAELLIEICDKYLEARLLGLLKPSQIKLARQAEVVTRVCAKIGIIALIDEATGFQEVRAKQALQLKLQAFIADEMQEWARMFPDQFWFELARLEGVRYSPRSRPLRWGKYIMMFVYDAVDEDVGRELRLKNPNPRFLKNHHQWLKKHGKEKVHDQIERVITIMKLCDDMSDFREKFSRVFKKSPTKLPFDDLWGQMGMR